MLNLTHEQMSAVRRHYGFADGEPHVEVESDSGSDAFFIPIDNKHGVKFYYDEDNAKRYYHWMRILAAMNIASRVWEFGSISLIKSSATVSKYAKRTLWYFHTERVAVLNRVHDAKEHGIGVSRLSRMRQKVCTRMNEELGIGHGDRHSGNFGIVRGRCVAIDVGGLHTVPGYDYLT